MDILFYVLAAIGVLWCVTGIKRESGNIATALHGELVPSERQTGCGEFALLFVVFGVFMLLFLAGAG